MSDEIINSPLSEIEFLVFSSHKTATQTITKSLNASGTKARHCHTLDNIDIPEGDFRSCLDAYRRQHMRALGIISVFRDPLDRLVSSFFQSASRWLSPSELIEQQPERSLINRLSFDALGKVFCDYCLQFNGFGESLEIICKELGIAVADLRFSPSENLGANDRDSCHLFLMRFDVMSDDQALGPLLERITGTTIALSSENVSAGKALSASFVSCMHNTSTSA